jgi:hypothetical protein
VRDVRKARQRLSGFLLRHGRIYARKAWTQAHRRRLTKLAFEQPAQARRDRLTGQIEELLPDWSMAPVVAARRRRRKGPGPAAAAAGQRPENP